MLWLALRRLGFVCLAASAAIRGVPGTCIIQGRFSAAGVHGLGLRSGNGWLVGIRVIAPEKYDVVFSLRTPREKSIFATGWRVWLHVTGSRLPPGHPSRGSGNCGSLLPGSGCSLSSGFCALLGVDGFGVS
ncbi:hypothetical protein QBC34DRAFT_56802 [Podospora aff. communis PSN243]|uniref:Secreted protein n=1 Tax=Podospora aff. communis PSN243 TaxID=3040156 RepID=A0AAV9GVR3_9PEZI|nr:hypothetical protein QBC34DRAFT_56802 [Podospora aff. communis PSN243]